MNTLHFLDVDTKLDLITVSTPRDDVDYALGDEVKVLGVDYKIVEATKVWRAGDGAFTFSLYLRKT